MAQVVKKILLVFFLFTAFGSAWAQSDSANVLQFSGLVVEKDDSLPVPNAVVFVPKRRSGAMANLNGYFSLPVAAGDSVVIASMGFKKYSIIIPDTVSGSFNWLVELEQDTLTLPMTDVYLRPSERQFKQELLAMRLPENNYNAMRDNLSPEVLSLMLAYSEMDASMNHTYYTQQQVIARENRAINPALANPLLDPMAWGRFFRDLKAEKKKREEEERRKRNNQGYGF